ncbi:chemotaxis protein CheB [Silvibacterium acidisoli]|uniref:chemotaxis protein CheB n=1 Tax=Acidobacteriaceae bacterium ZG23-2 TaxID=2883246 RepID=UPI00406C96E0
MTDDLPEMARGIAEFSRRLAGFSFEVISEGRASVQATREVMRQYQRSLNKGPQESAPAQPIGLPGEPVRHEGWHVDHGNGPVKVIVIGGSAGSTVAVRAIVARLPQGFPATFFVLQHCSPGWLAASSAGLIQSYASMPVHIAADLQPFHPAQIYVCPPDHHLTLEDGLMRLERSPRESFARPSIDVLFRSAASIYGRRMIGVILSGTLSDGTAGLWQIKKRGGIAIVQEPSEAEFPGMPLSAIENNAVDYVLPADSIADKLIELVARHPSRVHQTRVLIVEDESLVAQNLQEQLHGLSYFVCDSVSSGEDAITAAAEKNPDVIFMDIQLAGKINGIVAARQIWERLQIPVVFITAHADLKTLAEVKTAEHYGYLVKPFHTGSLRAVTELALDRREKELRRSR